MWNKHKAKLFEWYGAAFWCSVNRHLANCDNFWGKLGKACPLNLKAIWALNDTLTYFCNRKIQFLKFNLTCSKNDKII